MVMASPAPALMRIRDVQRVLAISRAGVYRLIDRGELRSVVIGPGARSRRIEAQSVYDYIAALSQ